VLVGLVGVACKLSAAGLMRSYGHDCNFQKRTLRASNDDGDSSNSHKLALPTTHGDSRKSRNPALPLTSPPHSAFFVLCFFFGELVNLHISVAVCISLRIY
jgi:hypothetical protein